ncbi:hypothetical protein RFI_33989, partial [Reticulomyxa filosa]
KKKGKIGDVSDARMISFQMNYLSFKLATLYSITFVTTIIAYVIIISNDTYIALIASTDILINTICLLFSFKFMDKHYRKCSALCGCMHIGRQEFSQILKLVDANSDLRMIILVAVANLWTKLLFLIPMTMTIIKILSSANMIKAIKESYIIQNYITSTTTQYKSKYPTAFIYMARPTTLMLFGFFFVSFAFAFVEKIA